MNKKYYFPLHFDGGNRGCEGIAKGTAVLLDGFPSNLIAYSRDVSLDSKLGIDKYYTLQQTHSQSLCDKFEKFVEKIFCHTNPTDLYFKYEYRHFLNQIKKDDIMISTGGDMMCYNNNMVNTTNDILTCRGTKTILWGCSMGEENYTPEKHATLKKFSLVYARESLTFDYLISIGLKNVICLPDPAFVLSPQKVELPTIFQKGDVIGLNISPYVVGKDCNAKLADGVKTFVKYVLENTNYHILLIPHVLWSGQDDRIVSRRVADLFNCNDRIMILDSEKFNYLQIRYIISKCRFFIGGRTHSVISAYSVCVPSIAIGYSIKAAGIAKDLHLPHELVVDSKENDSSKTLLEAFLYLSEHEKTIKSHLLEFMPSYIDKTYSIRDFLSQL